MQLPGILNSFGLGKASPLGGKPNVGAPAQAGSPAATTPIGDQVELRGTSDPTRYLSTPEGEKIALPEKGRFAIGRSKESQVRLEGDLISRNHCQAEFRNNQLWLLDTSSNGTFVNGKALPKGEWVEVPAQAQIGFGQPLHALKLGSTAPPSDSQEVWQGPNGQSFQWPAGQDILRVGRSDESHLRPTDSLVSGNHAMLRRHQGQVMVLDMSRNGTFINGERIPAQTWTALPAGASLAFGDPELQWSAPASKPAASAAASGPQNIALPDGRSGVVEFLADGRVQLGKVMRTLGSEDFTQGEFAKLNDGFSPIHSGAQLRRGDKLAWTEGNMFYNGEVLGQDAQGQLQIGRSQTFANRGEYESYLRNKQEAVDRARAEETQRQQGRQARAEAQRQHWQQQLAPLGFDPSQPQQAAHLLLQRGVPLGVDGISLWSPEVEASVMALKQAELASQPLAGRGTVESSGLLPLRLAQWQAEQRGEFLLVRGIVGENDPKAWGRFYTSDLGAAVGYAGGLSHDKQGQVVGLSLPKSDLGRFYRNVGSLPGRNPYAEVYDIGKGDLPAERQPQVLLNSFSPQQAWVFQDYARNAHIQDGEQGRADYQRLNQLITGQQ